MNAVDVVREIVDAHGGEGFWRGLEAVEAVISARGFLFTAKRRPPLVRVRMRASTREPHFTFFDGNWGYPIATEQRSFAHSLVDAGVDLIHGHSSHHVKGIEVYNGKLILYGCGDFINDYEGIEGYEEYRDDLTLMYFPTLAPRDGRLLKLRMVPLQRHRFRLRRTDDADTAWLAATLNREGRVLGTSVVEENDGLLLQW